MDRILPVYNHIPCDQLYTYELTDPEARVLSRWINIDGQDRGPALTILSCPDALFSADLPWKVALLPYAITSSATTLLNISHREIWAGVLAELNGKALPVRIVKGVNLYPMIFKAEDVSAWLVAVINLGADDQPAAELEFPDLEKGRWNLEMLTVDGRWLPSPQSSPTGGGRMRLALKAPAFTASVIRLRRL